MLTVVKAAGSRLRQAESLSGLVPSLSLQVAQQDRLLIAVGEVMEFLVHHRAQLRPVTLVSRSGRFSDPDLTLKFPLTSGPRAQVACQAVGHAGEPASDGLPPAPRAGLARQHEKGCLENVLGKLAVSQQPPANTKHEGAVPLHQNGKGRLVPLGGKAFQQRAIGLFTGGRHGEKVVNVPKNGLETSVGHARYPRWSSVYPI
jgi:hypothetical protein